ncbi:competence type IV pilus minor pilin ComGG [Lentibacillus halodurans]|uniref:competence type IV pilus minor pilin ComGG n=1 Tax=Lentibacillus halodurans TaxID=237679 RepID=UPI000B7CC05C|nr:competence type IV pilus minor pilin ComGG [Lentibacillus halodurans]
MKKSLLTTINQRGFVLPYVLFVIALAIIIVTANVHLYQDEIRITHNQSEQLKIETLFQMARMQFKEDIFNQNESNSTMSYVFPYGNVLIEYAELSELQYHLFFTIQTDTGITHSIINRIKLKPE